jgi:hypothetical protein
LCEVRGSARAFPLSRRERGTGGEDGNLETCSNGTGGEDGNFEACSRETEVRSATQRLVRGKGVRIANREAEGYASGL